MGSGSLSVCRQILDLLIKSLVLVFQGLAFAFKDIASSSLKGLALAFKCLALVFEGLAFAFKRLVLAFTGLAFAFKSFGS